MSTFQAIYSDEQRAAVAEAYEDRRIRPARKVAALAASGELTGEPFDIRPNYVQKLAGELRRRRAGQRSSELAAQPARDAVETLRQRLVNLADWMAGEHEKKRRAGTLTPVEIRELARCLREIAAIPGPDDARPTQPGARQPGAGNAGGPTRGGLAGQMLRDMDASVDRADEPGISAAPPTNTTHNTTPELNTTAQHAHTATDDESGDKEDGPDSWLRARVASLQGQPPA